MDFVGTGRRLAAGDLGYAARWLGIETAVLLAFMEVEAAGRGFDSRNRPKMLRETHRFYAELGQGEKRDAAVRQGIATRNWVRNYPRDSYPDLTRMIAIDETAALKACSWGLGQILASNHAGAGHRTAQEMVRTAMQGEREQLLQVVALMKAWGMQPMLTGKDFTKADSWRPAAGKWNGPAYASHDYHGRMATAYAKHARKDMDAIGTGQIVLRNGMRGEAVRALQADLAALGYTFSLGIDGRFGNETEGNVKAFQHDRGLVDDGRAGRLTLAALAEAVEAMQTDRSPPPPVWEGQQPPAAPTTAPKVERPPVVAPDGTRGGKGGTIALVVFLLFLGALFAFLGFV